MIPVDQTLFGCPGGNCLAACLASIFETSIDEVDSEALRKDGTWWGALTDVCQRYGYQPFSYRPGGSFPQIEPPGLHIACNDTHATVAFDGRVLFDPHPRRTGLPEITEWIILLPIALPSNVSAWAVTELIHG